MKNPLKQFNSQDFILVIIITLFAIWLVIFSWQNKSLKNELKEFETKKETLIKEMSSLKNKNKALLTEMNNNECISITRRLESLQETEQEARKTKAEVDEKIKTVVNQSQCEKENLEALGNGSLLINCYE